MSHNGYSQRNWVTAQGRDLYKGNGRVRHESYYILQGPFQAMLYLSYQSKEINPNLKDKRKLFKLGGEYHAEVYVFRNKRFNPSWKCIEHFDVKDFTTFTMKGKSRGQQSEARRRGILLFIKHILTGDTGITKYSDLSKHGRPVKIMSGIYRSIARRKAGLNPLVKMKL